MVFRSLAQRLSVIPGRSRNRWLMALLGAMTAQQTWAFETTLPGVEIRAETTLQSLAADDHYGTFGGHDRYLNLEGRLDVSATCIASWCAGTRLMLKPRVRYFRSDTNLPSLPEPKTFSWTEAYATGHVSDAFTWLAGKRYLAWGPGLLYSPTNRLFPDNGTATPRREIAGKWMGMASYSPTSTTTVSGLIADPYLQATPGISGSGGFGLLHAEYQSTGARPTSAGVVAGGGGAYRPYIGGYIQRLLDDAWTVGAEFSASRGYASTTGSGPALRENDRRWMADALVNLRYGLRSGGELGVEYIYNGYRLGREAMRDPVLAAQPAGGAWQTRNRSLHPLPEGHYLNLQALLPSLFGDRRFGVVFRTLTALSSGGNLTFLELSFSPRDDVTAYLGLTRTFGPSDAPLVRSLSHGVYAAIEIYL